MSANVDVLAAPTFLLLCSGADWMVGCPTAVIGFGAVYEVINCHIFYIMKFNKSLFLMEGFYLEIYSTTTDLTYCGLFSFRWLSRVGLSLVLVAVAVALLGCWQHCSP